MNDPVAVTTSGGDRQRCPWPDDLDALRAAPEHHTLLMENERVRVLETHIPPGEVTAVHTHRWPSVYYILSWSDFVRYDDQGKILVDTRKLDSGSTPPNTLWSEPLPPHSLENAGESEIRLISVELKDSEE